MSEAWPRDKYGNVHFELGQKPTHSGGAAPGRAGKSSISNSSWKTPGSYLPGCLMISWGNWIEWGQKRKGPGFVGETVALKLEEMRETDIDLDRSPELTEADEIFDRIE